MMDKGVGHLTKLFVEAVNAKNKADKEKAVKFLSTFYPKLEKAAMKRHKWYDIEAHWYNDLTEGILQAMIPLLKKEGYNAFFKEASSYTDTPAMVRVSGWDGNVHY